MNDIITKHEWQVLEMLAGERSPEWGAWVAECLECLKVMGLADGMYFITDEGKKALADRRGRANDDAAA